MVQPDLADEGGEDDQGNEEPAEAQGEAFVDDGDGDEQGGADVREAEVDLSDEDLGGDLFDGVESAASEDVDDNGEDQGDDGDESAADEADLDGIGDGLEGNAAELESAINEGAARLGVVGLTEDDFEDSDMTLDGLEDELRETFAAFRLGYFGSQSVEKYVLEPAEGDVSPAWGLAGSTLMAAAMVVWLRPDGDDAIERAREAVRGIGGSA